MKTKRSRPGPRAFHSTMGAPLSPAGSHRAVRRGEGGGCVAGGQDALRAVSALAVGHGELARLQRDSVKRAQKRAASGWWQSVSSVELFPVVTGRAGLRDVRYAVQPVTSPT